MNLVEKLMEEIDTLTIKDFHPIHGKIWVVDDGDGIQYIAKWEYPQPIPAGLTLGKPGGN
jgi:hypothetical protein